MLYAGRALKINRRLHKKTLDRPVPLVYCLHMADTQYESTRVLPTDGAVRLARWVQRSGRTKLAVAGSLGISPQMMSALLNGTRRPSLALAERLRKTLGIPMRAWVAED